MNFIPNNDIDRKIMLDTIGLKSVSELFNHIPEKAKIANDLQINDGMSEMTLSRNIRQIADKSKFNPDTVSFMGGGIYDHYIPSTVEAIASRGDFFTAYTPYQAEVSQGTLQVIFEYQSMICELTGMEVSNASHYDGANALASAIEMIFIQAKKKKKILISSLINPNYMEVIKTQFSCREFEFISMPETNGCIDVDKVSELIDKDIAGIVIQNPNYTGNIEDIEKLVTIAKENKILSAVCQYPISLSLLKRPGDLGFDIVCGEGQSLGISQSFGGPALGYIACSTKLMRKMPGRIVGETVDTRGQKAYVLTLQAREQHIRREKASSNICSNQALCALSATVYLSTIGKLGFKKIGEYCVQAAHHLAREIENIEGINLVYGDRKFFNEFVIELPVDADSIYKKMMDKFNIAPGIPLKKLGKEYSKRLLVTVTEKRSSEDINNFIEALKEVIK